MKYATGVVLAVLCLLAFADVQQAAAFAFLNTPFGGRVTMTTVPLVTCSAGTGPVSMTPAGQSTATDYLFPHGKTRAPQGGQWTLGLYEGISDESCLQGVKPYQKPYSTHRVMLWGTSGTQ